MHHGQYSILFVKLCEISAFRLLITDICSGRAAQMMCMHLALKDAMRQTLADMEEYVNAEDLLTMFSPRDASWLIQHIVCEVV